MNGLERVGREVNPACSIIDLSMKAAFAFSPPSFRLWISRKQILGQIDMIGLQWVHLSVARLVCVRPCRQSGLSSLQRESQCPRCPTHPVSYSTFTTSAAVRKSGISLLRDCHVLCFPNKHGAQNRPHESQSSSRILFPGNNICREPSGSCLIRPTNLVVTDII